MTTSPKIIIPEPEITQPLDFYHRSKPFDLGVVPTFRKNAVLTFNGIVGIKPDGTLTKTIDNPAIEAVYTITDFPASRSYLTDGERWLCYTPAEHFMQFNVEFTGKIYYQELIRDLNIGDQIRFQEMIKVYHESIEK